MSNAHMRQENAATQVSVTMPALCSISYARLKVHRCQLDRESQHESQQGIAMPTPRTTSSARERIRLWWDLCIIVLVNDNDQECRSGLNSLNRTEEILV